MVKLDRAGIVWGIFIAVIINGLYDCLILALENQWQTVVYTAIITLAVTSLIAVIFRETLFSKHDGF